jgi:curved DNA-binding protein CbpA
VADPVEPDLYALLGVRRDADAREVARAYRRRLREVHPDTRASDADPDTPSGDLRRLQDAYRVLRDPVLRARYDAQRAAGERTRPPRGVPVPVRVRPARPEPLIRFGPVRHTPHI